MAALDAKNNAFKAGLQARMTALDAAWSLTDSKARNAAIKAAWTAWAQASSSAAKAMRTAKNAAWTQFRADGKACGAPASAYGVGADANL